MEDNQIIQLYWDRNDQAIQATAEKYGRYCAAIAKNILKNDADAEECVNDAYLHAWNAMPTQWPRQLAAFLGRITRNLSLNQYRRDRAEKRGGGELVLILNELADCVSDRDDPAQAIDRRELIQALNAFVRRLPTEKRSFFVRRYWYAEPVSQIAKDAGRTPASVSKTLERTRKQLKAYLIERGFDL